MIVIVIVIMIVIVIVNEDQTRSTYASCMRVENKKGTLQYLTAVV